MRFKFCNRRLKPGHQNLRTAWRDILLRRPLYRRRPETTNAGGHVALSRRSTTDRGQQRLNGMATLNSTKRQTIKKAGYSLKALETRFIQFFSPPSFSPSFTSFPLLNTQSTTSSTLGSSIRINVDAYDCRWTFWLIRSTAYVALFVMFEIAYTRVSRGTTTIHLQVITGRLSPSSRRGFIFYGPVARQRWRAVQHARAFQIDRKSAVYI